MGPFQLNSFIPGNTPNNPDGKSYDIALPQQAGKCAIAEIHNNSPYAFYVYASPGSTSNYGDYLGILAIQAQDSFRLPKLYQKMTFSPITSLQQSQAPLSLVYGDLYPEALADWAEAGQIQYIQQTNIGNGSVGSNASSVYNVAGATGTAIVTGGISGASTNAINMSTDGTISFAAISNGVWTSVFSITPGGPSTAYSAVFHGTADVASTATNATSASGLASSYIVPLAQMASGYPASSLGTGTVPSGVSVPAAQVSGGTFPSGVNLPAAQVLAGTLPMGVVWGDIAQDTIGSSPITVRLKTPTSGSTPYQLGAVTWDGTAAHGVIVVDTKGNVIANRWLANDSGTGSSPPSSLTQQFPMLFTGLTDPTLVSGSPTPVTGSLWVQDSVQGTNTTEGNTTTPGYGWNSYGSTAQQAWVVWNPGSDGGTISSISFYAEGDGSTSTSFYVCVWDNATGDLVGYAGPNSYSGGSASSGGQAWHTITCNIDVAANTAYRIGWQRGTTLTDWSVYSGNQSPFSAFGYTSPSGGSPSGNGGYSNPAANFPPGVYFVFATGSPGHLNIWRTGAWEQVI